MAHLNALLEREASAEIEAISSEAQTRVSEIRNQAQADADARVAKAERELASQSEATKVRAESAAKLEASSQLLNAKQVAVEHVFEQARAEIDAIVADGRRYPSIFKKLLKEATEALAGEVAQVVVHSKDKAIAEEAVAAQKLKAQVVTDDAIFGGVKVKAAKSNTSIVNTLPERLAAVRDEAASEVSHQLFQKKG